MYLRSISDLWYKDIERDSGVYIERDETQFANNEILDLYMY